MLFPERSGRLLLRGEGAEPSRPGSSAVLPLTRERGSALKHLPGRNPPGVTGGRRGLHSRTEKRGAGSCVIPTRNGFSPLVPITPEAGDISRMVKGFTAATGEFGLSAPTLRPGMEPTI